MGALRSVLLWPVVRRGQLAHNNAEPCRRRGTTRTAAMRSDRELHMARVCDAAMRSLTARD